MRADRASVHIVAGLTAILTGCSEVEPIGPDIVYSIHGEELRLAHYHTSGHKQGDETMNLPIHINLFAIHNRCRDDVPPQASFSVTLVIPEPAAIVPGTVINVEDPAAPLSVRFDLNYESCTYDGDIHGTVTLNSLTSDPERFRWSAQGSLSLTFDNVIDSAVQDSGECDVSNIGIQWRDFAVPADDPAC